MSTPSSFGLFSAALLFLTVSCEPPVRRPPPPPLVTIAKPKVQTVIETNVFVGHTEAIRSVDVRARLEGWLQTIDFTPSESVEKGQLLFTIEPDTFELAVKNAEASVAQNDAEVARTEADLKRVEQAVKTNAVSVAEVSLRRADRDKAIAVHDSAKAKLNNAKLELSYTKVHAPIGGKISRNLVDAGNLVGSGERTLLTTIMDIDKIYVYFDVSESFIVGFLRNRDEADINKAMTREERMKKFPIRAQLDGDEGYPHKGFIDFISNSVDSDTGTIQVRGEFDNKENRALYPGLFARIQIDGKPIENAVQVRDSAIGTDLAGKFILALRDADPNKDEKALNDGQKIVERIYVELGPLNNGWRVILKDLTQETPKPFPVDRDYIVDGTINARPGLPARIQTEEQAAARAGSK